jgi:hypothetical protein
MPTMAYQHFLLISWILESCDDGSLFIQKGIAFGDEILLHLTGHIQPFLLHFFVIPIIILVKGWLVNERVTGAHRELVLRRLCSPTLEVHPLHDRARKLDGLGILVAFICLADCTPRCSLNPHHQV